MAKSTNATPPEVISQWLTAANLPATCDTQREHSWVVDYEELRVTITWVEHLSRLSVQGLWRGFATNDEQFSRAIDVASGLNGSLVAAKTVVDPTSGRIGFIVDVPCEDTASQAFVEGVLQVAVDLFHHAVGVVEAQLSDLVPEQENTHV